MCRMAAAVGRPQDHCSLLYAIIGSILCGRFYKDLESVFRGISRGEGDGALVCFGA